MRLKPVTTLFVICCMCTISAANSVSMDQQECPNICTLNYKPLCATNGTIYKEFSNTCELKASNCRLERSALQKYIPTAMDWCKTELVDGFRQLLDKLNISSLDTPDCMEPCPLIYSPVCVSNGQYRAGISNECLMKAINCVFTKKTKASFSVLKYDLC